ncbi:hypothetical protein BG015_004474, partial [Linnemannia schmuckeri]
MPEETITRTGISLKKKLAIIVEAKRHPEKSHASLGSQFQCSRSTFSKILKHKFEIEEESKTAVSLNQKRYREGRWKLMEDAIAIFVEQRLAEKLYAEGDLKRDFTGAGSWPQHFKKRYGLFTIRLHGKAGSVDPVTVTEKRAELQELIA